MSVADVQYLSGYIYKATTRGATLGFCFKTARYLIVRAAANCACEVDGFPIWVTRQVGLIRVPYMYPRRSGGSINLQ